MRFNKNLALSNHNRSNRVILGAFIGIIFYLAWSFASKIAFSELNEWQSECMRTYHETISSLPIDQQQDQRDSGCLTIGRQFSYAFFQAGWFGPPILGALIVQTSGVWTFVQAYYWLVSSLIYAVIGSYFLAMYSPKHAILGFLMAFFATTYAIAIYIFILGLVINSKA